MAWASMDVEEVLRARLAEAEAKVADLERQVRELSTVDDARRWAAHWRRQAEQDRRNCVALQERLDELRLVRWPPVRGFAT